MFDMAINRKQVEQLANELKGDAKRVKRELKMATNKAAKVVRKNVSKKVREELVAPAAAVNSKISIHKQATDHAPSAVVRLKQSARIPLRDFGARQIKKGVSYRISKTQGRKTVPGAFQGPKPGVIKSSWRGRVFRRRGSARLPIQQLWGPSPWGVVVKNKFQRALQKQARREHIKQIQRRIDFRRLKNKGTI